MKKIAQIILISLSTSILTLFIASQLFSHKKEKNNYSPTPIVPTTYTLNNNNLTNAAPTDFVEAADKSIDAVVHVKNTVISKHNPSSPFSLFFGQNFGANKMIGTGSGVIVSSDGYIITNNHVIENGTELEITTNNNTVYKAEVVGSDPLTDIAVLKINADKELPYLYFGDSNQVKVGEWVLAIGNPFNLNSTVTAGIVSAKSRDLDKRDRDFQSFIQTDAAVNTGNSGGALVNTQGDLIGINTAIASINGGFQGYSFAVPSNIARKVFEDLIEYGNVQKGLLGVAGFSITPEFFKKHKLKQHEGFYVSELQPNMGAEKAGLKAGDIITQIDNIKIKTFSDLTGYLNSKRPKDVVNITYVRDNEIKNTTITLERINEQTFLGMKLIEPSQKEDGLLVSQSGNFMSRQVQKGSILLEINNNKITNLEDLNSFSEDDVRSLVFLTPKGFKERIWFRN